MQALRLRIVPGLPLACWLLPVILPCVFLFALLRAVCLVHVGLFVTTLSFEYINTCIQYIAIPASWALTPPVPWDAPCE
jgi:hypothetical protein